MTSSATATIVSFGRAPFKSSSYLPPTFFSQPLPPTSSLSSGDHSGSGAWPRMKPYIATRDGPTLLLSSSVSIVLLSVDQVSRSTGACQLENSRLTCRPYRRRSRAEKEVPRQVDRGGNGVFPGENRGDLNGPTDTHNPSANAHYHTLLLHLEQLRHRRNYSLHIRAN